MPRAARVSTKRSTGSSVPRFDLRVERIGTDRFRATVVDGEAESEFDLPFKPEELEDFRRLIEGAGREIVPGDPKRELERRRRDPEQRLKDYGARLFERVFSGGVREAWIEKRGSLDGKRLALRLYLAHPELGLWPWEYLRDPKSPSFLALSSKISIVRYPSGPVAISPLPVSGPFRILGVISNPADSQALGGEVEWKNLTDDLARLVKCRRVALELLKPATLDALNTRLADPRQPPCHALHFIGHGDFDRERGEGSLYFENEHGSADRVSAEELATILADRGLRFVVLNSCHGAHGDAADPFSSVAQHLVRRGVAGVLAMRFSVADRFAISCSRHFYRRLAAGDPVDTALAETRVALYAEKFKLEWGSAILNLRASEGRIFDIHRWLPCWPIWASAVSLVGILVFAATLFWVRPEPRTTPVLSPLLEAPQAESSRASANPPECPSPSGLDMEFVLIKPEEASTDDKGAKAEVTLNEPFCLGKYEVTEGQWVRLMGSRWSLKAHSRLPAGSKSAGDADLYVEKLNQRDPEGGYRLPRKAEWEFAARAGSTERFSFGDDVADLWRFGNCKSELTPDGYEGRPAPVGKFEPNDFGLYDMHGNVWEWVSDAETAKPGGKPRRIRMGGSWDIQAENCNVDHFATSPPHTRYSDFGFRIVRKPVPPDQNKGAAQGPPQSPQP